MSIEEVPYHSITESRTGFYDGIDYDSDDEIGYNDDIEINRQRFRDLDEEPIYNYYEPY